MRSPHRFPRFWFRRLAALAAALALAVPAPHGVFRPAKLAGPSPAAYALKAQAPSEGASAAGLEEGLRGAADARQHYIHTLERVVVGDRLAMTFIPNHGASASRIAIAEPASETAFMTRAQSRQAGPQRLQFVDLATGRSAATDAPDLTNPTALAYHKGIVYVAQSEGRLHRFHVARRQWLPAWVLTYEVPDMDAKTHRRTIRLDQPGGLAVDGARGLLYVTESAAGRLVGFRLSDGTFTGFLVTNQRGAPLLAPDDVVVGPHPTASTGSALYVADRLLGTVRAYDPQTGASLALVLSSLSNPAKLAIDPDHRLLFVVSEHAGFLGGFRLDTGEKVELAIPTTDAVRRYYERHVANIEVDIAQAADVVYDPHTKAIILATHRRLIPFWVTASGIVLTPPSAGLEASDETARDLRLLAERFQEIGIFTLDELGEIKSSNLGAKRLDVAIEVAAGDESGPGRTVTVTVHGLGRSLRHLRGTAIALRNGLSQHRVQLRHEEGTGAVAEFSTVPATDDDQLLTYTLELAAGLEEGRATMTIEATTYHGAFAILALAVPVEVQQALAPLLHNWFGQGAASSQLWAIREAARGTFFAVTDGRHVVRLGTTATDDADTLRGWTQFLAADRAAPILVSDQVWRAARLPLVVAIHRAWRATMALAPDGGHVTITAMPAPPREPIAPTTSTPDAWRRSLADLLPTITIRGLTVTSAPVPLAEVAVAVTTEPSMTPWMTVTVRVADPAGRPIPELAGTTITLTDRQGRPGAPPATLDAAGTALFENVLQWDRSHATSSYQLEVAAGLEEPTLEQREANAVAALDTVQRAARAARLSTPIDRVYFLKDDAILLAPAFERLGLRFLVRVETSKAAKALVTLGVPADRMAGALSADESADDYRMQGITRVANAAWGDRRFLDAVHRDMDPWTFESVRTVQRIPGSDSAWISFWADWPLPDAVRAQLTPAVQATEAYVQAMG